LELQTVLVRDVQQQQDWFGRIGSSLFVWVLLAG
jgi:hypothetical protein